VKTAKIIARRAKEADEKETVLGTDVVSRNKPRWGGKKGQETSHQVRGGSRRRGGKQKCARRRLWGGGERKIWRPLQVPGVKGNLKYASIQGTVEGEMYNREWTIVRSSDKRELR